MSALHVAASLRDGGAMASHLVATQPWAPWLWLCTLWQPPADALQEPAKPPNAAAAAPAAPAARPTAPKQGAGSSTSATSSSRANSSPRDKDVTPVAPAPPQTPGGLALALGVTAPTELAVRLLAAPRGAAGAARSATTTAALLESLAQWQQAGDVLARALRQHLRLQQ